MKWQVAPDSVLACEMADAGRPTFARMFPWVWLVWLFYLFGPAMFGDKGMEHWLWPTLASVPVFVALYIVAYVVPRRRVLGIASVVAALAMAVTPWNPYAMTYMIYASAVAADWGAIRHSAGAAACLLLVYSAEWLGFRFPWPLLVYLWALCLIVAGMIWYGGIQRERRADLRLSMDEVRRLATSAERERIGRDLHDLLGHTLSMVALKSELAGRLIERDPTAAKREIADVERVAREALAEVRGAVSGMRAAALTAELASARLLLETSGVHMQYRYEVGELPAALETCLALVLREAAVNISRHARAASAEVDVRIAGGVARMQIRDDGRGGVNRRGNGLAGMRERVERLDGTFTIDSPRGQGTRIDVTLPLAKPAISAKRVRAPDGTASAPVMSAGNVSRA